MFCQFSFSHFSSILRSVFFYFFVSMTKYFLGMLCSLALLSGCTHSGPASNTAYSSTTPSAVVSSIPSPSSAMNTLQKALPAATDEIAVITTNKGKIVLRFFAEEAPKTVENFLGLSKKGYYNGIIFHRVIDGFMIQGGDPTGTGSGGESLWGEDFKDEFSSAVKNKRGSISMANRGPATNSSQFFINQKDNLFLDGRHTVFGEVIEGMDVVDAIAKVKKDSKDKPVENVTMEKVEVMPYSQYKK